MLSAQPLKSIGKGSVRGIVEYLKLTEYYSAENNILPEARWYGTGVELLGLNREGRDANKDFARLLEGYNPNKRTGAKNNKLVQNAGSDSREFGWDFTFNSSKAFSIAYASADSDERKRMDVVMAEAVNAGLDFFGQEATSRTGKAGTGEPVKSPNIVVRCVTHIDSRDGDPHWHTHAVIMNASADETGKWRSIGSGPVLELQKSAGAIFDQKLAEGFEALGYGVVKEREQVRGFETGGIKYGLAGIGQEIEEHFSKRRLAIVAEVKKSAERGEVIDENLAAQRTRKRKGKASEPDTVIDYAQATISRMHEEGGLQWKDNSQLKAINPDLEFLQKAHAEMFSALHATESAFTRYDLIERLAKEGDTDPARTASALLEAQKDGGQVIELSAGRKGQPRYCSKAQWDLEAVIGVDGLKRQHESQLHLSRAQVEASITQHEQAQAKASGKPFTLTQEQRQVVLKVACETGGLALISGNAGTGKTATAGAYIRAFEASGYEVIGTSTSEKATKNLQAEAKINAYNTTDLLSQLDSGKIILTNKSVLLIDEAGMVGAKNFRALQQHIDKAQGKIIAVGDFLQLQPIEAGNPFKDLIAKIGDSKLTEIRRQKNEAERQQAFDFYQGKSGHSIVEQWKDNGQLNIAKEKECVKQLVRDYTQNQKPQRDKLILAQTHNAKDAITSQLREELKNNCTLKNPHTLQTLDRNGKKTDLEVCQGERVKFQSNNKKLGVSNGDFGEVIGFKKLPAGLVMEIRLESDIKERNGQIIAVPTWARNCNDFTHGYVQTVHSAQGLGVDDVYMLARGGKPLDRSMGMVAFTRTKETFHAYATETEAKNMAVSLDHWGRKETAKDMAKPERTIQPLNQVEEVFKKITEQQTEEKARLGETYKSPLQKIEFNRQASQRIETKSGESEKALTQLQIICLIDDKIKNLASDPNVVKYHKESARLTQEHAGLDERYTKVKMGIDGATNSNGKVYKGSRELKDEKEGLMKSAREALENRGFFTKKKPLEDDFNAKKNAFDREVERLKKLEAEEKKLRTQMIAVAKDFKNLDSTVFSGRTGKEWVTVFSALNEEKRMARDGTLDIAKWERILEGGGQSKSLTESKMDKAIKAREQEWMPGQDDPNRLLDKLAQKAPQQQRARGRDRGMSM